MPILWIFFLFPSLAYADFTGTVLTVKDSDTLVVQHGTEQITTSLNGIDCPEKAQRFGPEATALVEELAQGVRVIVRGSSHDRYGRLLATIELPDGRDLNQELVKRGLAWWFFKYSNDQELGQLELSAKLTHTGLWADRNPIPPWLFQKVQELLH